MDLESRCGKNKSTCRHQEENADGCLSSENPVVLKDDGTGISEHSAIYRRGQFDDRVTYLSGTRYFSSEESALEELFQAKTMKLNNASLRSVEHASSGLTSSSPVSDVTHETALSISLARQLPPVQVMERSMGYDHDRISSSVFERSGSGTPLEWSAASSESLFSLKIGNASFTIDHDIILGGDQHKSEESEKPGELVGVTPPPTIKMAETEGSKAVNGRKPGTAKVVDDSMKEHVKEARVEIKGERFYTPTTSWDSSRASNQSDGCTTSTNSTMKCTWPFCCFTGLSCSWRSCCCKMPSCSYSDCSCSFCSCSRQSYCPSNGQGEFCSNSSCSSLSCCSGKACSSCSLKSLSCCGGKVCSYCSLKSLWCCSGKACSCCSLKSLCCCTGKACLCCSLKWLCCCSGYACSSCSLKSLCCCSEKTCSRGFCSNCDCNMQQLWGCWNCSCCRNKSCSSKCCG